MVPEIKLKAMKKVALYPTTKPHFHPFAQMFLYEVQYHVSLAVLQFHTSNSEMFSISLLILFFCFCFGRLLHNSLLNKNAGISHCGFDL